VHSSSAHACIKLPMRRWDTMHITLLYTFDCCVTSATWQSLPGEQLSAAFRLAKLLSDDNLAPDDNCL
jgi:hypothetical protein